MTRSVRPLLSADLQALTTERLLVYRYRHRSLEDSAALSYRDGSEAAALDENDLCFKDQPACCDLYAEARRVLATRERRLAVETAQNCLDLI